MKRVHCGKSIYESIFAAGAHGVASDETFVIIKNY